MTTDDDSDPADELIPAAPCPTCRREPQLTADRIGHVVRCRGCGTRFRAAPAAPSPPTPGEPADAEPRPRRDSAGNADGNPYDDGYGRFEEEHTPGRVVALAVMHFVYCGLLSVCGILSAVFVQVYPKALPGPHVTPSARTFLYVIHALMVLAAVPLLVAGWQTLQKRPAARTWGVVGLALAGLLLAVNLVQVALNLPLFTGLPGETTDIMCGLTYQLLFWLGYMIPVGVMLIPGTKPAETESRD